MENKNYPLYEVPLVNNLKELVNFTAEKFGGAPAFTFERENETVTVSYAAFKSDTEAFGTAMLAETGGRSVKAALLGENSYEWILAYLSAVNGGNVIVPLDRDLRPADIRNLTDDSGAEIFIYSGAYADTADFLKKSGAGVKSYINLNETGEFVKRGAALIKNGEKTFINREIDNNALTALLYTSGTTGLAKGVMLSHFNIARDAIGCARNLKIEGTNLLILPLHHSFGLTAGVIYALLSGGEIAINQSLKHVVDDCVKFKPRSIFMVPLVAETFYKMIWDGAAKQGREKTLQKLLGASETLLENGADLRREIFKPVLAAFGGELETIITGGAPIDPKYIKGLRDFGINALNGYGITECSPVVSVNRNNFHRDGSVGQICPCCEVKIAEANESGHGEVLVKGDIVMRGYYKNEKATSEAFSGEWFKTGDIGYIDGDGFLFISGRKKNLIVLSNGKNVHPEELEFLLCDIPYVREAVVYEKGGVITAELFLDTDGDPECASRLAGDIDELNKTLPTYKNIGRTFVRDTEFRKTTTKKIKRTYD